MRGKREEKVCIQERRKERKKRFAYRRGENKEKVCK